MTDPDQPPRTRAGDVFDRLSQRLLDHDMAGFAALWDPEGTIGDTPRPAADRSRHDRLLRYAAHAERSTDAAGCTPAPAPAPTWRL